jgi:hypothetical protein
MNLQTYLWNIIIFLNNVIIPLLLAMAALVFLFNVTRYFIIGGENPDSQEKARSLAVWGILGFVIILSIWGIVTMLTYSLGFGDDRAITPDYMELRQRDVR